jgi:pyoverdine/dityrosine biosynthesis protein Dit1
VKTLFISGNHQKYYVLKISRYAEGKAITQVNWGWIFGSILLFAKYRELEI